MKNRSIIIITAVMIMVGIAGSVNAASMDITTTGITVTGTDRINDEQGFPMTVPAGIIVMWSGTVVDIPDGWGLCDGGSYNGTTTPNLVDRFILGAGANIAIGSMGDGTGATQGHPLTVPEMPPHTHEYNKYVVGGGNDSMFTAWDTWTTDALAKTTSTGGDGSSTMEGKEHIHNIIDYKPKYYALAFIMKLP